MLKPIKKTKQMRLDELIKYVWENNIENKRYRNDNGQIVKFLKDGRFETGWDIGSEDLFPVEIEEEITEDTRFEKCVVIFKDKSTISTPLEHNIKFIKKYYKNIKYIYALIDGKLELIWEADND